MSGRVGSSGNPAGSFGRRVESANDPNITVLTAGVDSLYLSFSGELQDGLAEALNASRDLAGDEAAVISYREEDGSYLLRSHGSRGYPFWLSSPRCELFLGAAKPFPPAYAALHSTYIHTVGIENAVAYLQKELSEVFFSGKPAASVSRIDLYADIQGWLPQSQDFNNFSCRGVRRRLYEQPRQLHGFGRALSGFTFGKGDIMGRIYDKTLEMRTRGSTWQEVIWRGRDLDAPVWRIEFQFRRKALTTFDIRTPSDALAKRQALWEYGTRWLSLRIPELDVNRSRWAESPVWTALRSAPIGSPCSELVRKRVRQANERRLVSGFVGYVSSLAAMSDTNVLGNAVGRAVPLALDYLDERGTSFSAIVERKRERRLDPRPGAT